MLYVHKSICIGYQITIIIYGTFVTNHFKFFLYFFYLHLKAYFIIIITVINGSHK